MPRIRPSFSRVTVNPEAPYSALPTVPPVAPDALKPLIVNGATVHSSIADVTVDVALKRLGGGTYLFAVGMRNRATTATFSLQRLAVDATVTSLATLSGASLSHRAIGSDAEERLTPLQLQLAKGNLQPQVLSDLQHRS
jgi:hypothetical protein